MHGDNTLLYPPPKDLTNYQSKNTGSIKFMHPIKQTQ